MRSASLALSVALATTGSARVARAEGSSEPSSALHLSVRGAIDGAALRAAIARELGVSVELVDEVCEVPCLAVAVDGDAAAITFSPRSGAPRMRAVPLAGDAAQWPLVVTLLAGNVVRDEAQDVLAGLPAGALRSPSAPRVDVPAPPPPAERDAPPSAPPPPPAATPPASALPAGPPREQRWLGLGLVPGLSTDFTRVGAVEHTLSIDLLVGVSGGSTGLAVSGVAGIERGPVSGAQLAGVATYAWQVSGTQIAGVAAVTRELTGLQISGVASAADTVDGVQIGGVVAVAQGRAATQIAGVAAGALGDTELQIGGVAAVARRAGLQIGGVVSVSGGDAATQIAGAVAVASGTTHTQIAGAVNVADRVAGVQIAPLNIASRVDGVQVGVINIGGSSDGFSFGLINIVPGGRIDLESAVDSSGIGTLMLRHGGRRWHNVYGFGGESVKETGPSDDVWMYGLGFGPSFEFGGSLLDVEAIGWQVNHGARHVREVSVLGQLRVSLAHRLGPVSIVAGGVFNTYVTTDAQSPLYLERSTGGGTMSKDVTVTMWPSAFIGLRI